MTKLNCVVCTYPFDMTPGKVHICERCGQKDRRFTQKSKRLSLAFSLSAIILLIPANFFPFMTIELYGQKNSTTIWSGITELLNDKSYLVALVIFMASILIPILKLLILMYLSLSRIDLGKSRFKMNLYFFVEAIGRWSMLDIFLLAILVAMVKLGSWTTVFPELGATLFAFVVIFTMLASAYFDPRILWEENDEFY